MRVEYGDAFPDAGEEVVAFVLVGRCMADVAGSDDGRIGFRAEFNESSQSPAVVGEQMMGEFDR